MCRLVEHDSDVAKYVPDMIENIKSGEKLRVEFGFSVLEKMGRYAYSAIPMLEEIREMKEFNSPEMKEAVDKTITAIQRDKEEYEKNNNEG